MKIQFRSNCARNTQMMMFSNTFMYREQLKGVTTLSEMKSAMEYDDCDNLTSYLRPGAATSEKKNGLCDHCEDHYGTGDTHYMVEDGSAWVHKPGSIPVQALPAEMTPESEGAWHSMYSSEIVYVIVKGVL